MLLGCQRLQSTHFTQEIQFYRTDQQQFFRLHSYPQQPLPTPSTRKQALPFLVTGGGDITHGLKKQPWANSGVSWSTLHLAGSLGLALTPILRKQVSFRNFSITWRNERSNLEQKGKKSHVNNYVFRLEEASGDLPLRRERGLWLSPHHQTLLWSHLNKPHPALRFGKSFIL